MKKKILCSLLLIVTIILVSSGNMKSVKAGVTGSITITPNTTNVIVGNQVSVTVSFNASAPGVIYGSCYFGFDPSYFDFVSCAQCGNTSNIYDSVTIDYEAGSQAITSGTATVVLKAKKTGTTNFSILNYSFSDFDIQPASMTTNTAAVKVWAQGSDDSSLKSLSVSGFSLSPAFTPGNVNYTCYVGTDTTGVSVNAATTQGGRTELGGNPSALNLGNNYITVVSYAPNGATSKYVINIVRPEPETTTVPPETTATPDDVDIKIGEDNYSVSSEIPSDSIPSGFNVTLVDFKGKDVLGAISQNLTLLYLVDKDNNGAFYIYNKEDQSFFKYQAFTIGDKTYVMMDPAKSNSAPSGCTEGSVQIGDTQIKALISDDAAEFSYFYAMNPDGDTNWYCYDSKEGTIQRMNIMSVGSNELSNADLQAFQNEITSLKDKNSKANKTRNLAIIIGGVLVVALTGIVIAMAVQKSGKKHSIDMDDNDDYSDDDDDNSEDNDLLIEDDTETETEAETEAAATTEETIEETKEDNTDEEIPVEDSIDEDTQKKTEILTETEAAETEDIVVNETEETEVEKAESESEVEEAEAEALTDEQITDEEVDAFAREAEAFQKELAVSVNEAVEEDDIEPEIISLDDDEEENDINSLDESDELSETTDDTDETTDVEQEPENKKPDEDEDFFL